MSNLQPAGAAGAPNILEEATVKAFKGRLRGELIRPGDAPYDEVRAVWNGIIDRYPALIARCANADDVIASVNFARENGMLLAVRGGGHNVAGNGTCDDGLVVDLSGMDDVQVDAHERIVRAAGGATIGDLDQATQLHGLATPMGVVSETGIAGLTLGGGYGWLRNKYGLSCDNLIAADVVTADGRLVRASESANSDLLWGLRGGGGNFGVVTAFEFKLYPVGPEVWFTAAFHDGARMKETLQLFREFCESAPDEISLLAVCGVFPPGAEIFPEELHGQPFALLIGMYAGPVAEGEDAMRPLRDFADPLVDFSGAMPYLDAQVFFDEDYPNGMRYYWKSLNLDRLDEDVIDRIVAHARRQPSPLSTTDIWHVGGVVKQVRPGESAFFGRQAAFLLSPEANWEDPQEDQTNVAWLREFIADMQEFSDGSRYLNFAGFQEEGDEMMRKAFGSQYDRLVALKNKYDPTNLFSLNQNIKPSG